jgi:serine/threonine-protein kinase SRPK3
MLIPKDTSLKSSEENLTGEDQQEFSRFVKSMLKWRPEDQKTAKQLLDDP